MKYSMCTIATTFCLGLLVACGGSQQDADAPGRSVQASGKEVTALAHVPAEVLAAARQAKPDLELLEAEHEVRDGRDYYDIGGRLPDGSEMELDMTQVDGVWTVVEFQRDIGIEALPVDVAAALAGAKPGWVPSRIIESDQGDGTIIYEFLGTDSDGQPVKTEVKWSDAVAEVLRDEWVH